MALKPAFPPTRPRGRAGTKATISAHIVDLSRAIVVGWGPLLILSAGCGPFGRCIIASGSWQEVDCEQAANVAGDCDHPCETGKCGFRVRGISALIGAMILATGPLTGINECKRLWLLKKCLKETYFWLGVPPADVSSFLTARWWLAGWVLWTG